MNTTRSTTAFSQPTPIGRRTGDFAPQGRVRCARRSPANGSQAVHCMSQKCCTCSLQAPEATYISFMTYLCIHVHGHSRMGRSAAFSHTGKRREKIVNPEAKLVWGSFVQQMPTLQPPNQRYAGLPKTCKTSGLGILALPLEDFYGSSPA